MHDDIAPSTLTSGGKIRASCPGWVAVPVVATGASIMFTEVAPARKAAEGARIDLVVAAGVGSRQQSDASRFPGGRSPAEEAADDPSEDRCRRLRRDRAPERSGSFADPVIGARKERDAAVRRLSEGGESQERNRAVRRSAFRRAQISADPGNIRFGRDSGSEERGDRGLPPFVGAFRPPTGSCPGPQICLRRIASVPGPFVSPRPFRRVQTEGAASASGCPRVSRSDRSVSKIGRRPRRALQAKIAAQRRCFVSGSV